MFGVTILLLLLLTSCPGVPGFLGKTHPVLVQSLMDLLSLVGSARPSLLYINPTF